MYQKLGAGGFWVESRQRIAVPLIVGWVVCSR
jgi:hypothetical protein